MIFELALATATAMVGATATEAPRFLSAQLAPLLLFAPAAWLASHRLDRARARRLAQVVGPRWTTLAGGVSPGGRALRTMLGAVAVLLAAVALLEPAWGEPGAVRRRGVEVVVCLDVSRSMLARDVPPSRLERAREEILELAAHARGDRFALVAFAGEARRIVPLTEDAESFASLAAQASPESVRRGGTDLGAAIEAARSALPAESGAVIVMSDGEDSQGRGAEAARTCRERGIVVHCVGLGTERGSKVVIETDRGETFLRDTAGREVISARDDESLRAIAAAGGGAFVAIADSRPALVPLFEEHVLPLARTLLDPRERREHESRYQWPVLGCVLLLVLRLAMRDRSRA